MQDRRAALAVLVLFLAAAALSRPGDASREPDADLVLVPFAVDEVRARVPVEAGLLVANGSREGRAVHVERVHLEAAGRILDERVVDRRLDADEGYLDLNALIERLPDEVSHAHRDARVFADPGAPTFAGAEVGDRLAEIAERVGALRERHATGIVSFVEPKLDLSLDRVFAETDAPGTAVSLVFTVDYRTESGEARTASVARRLVWKGPRPGLPAHLAGTGMSIHAGDLHVHSCHGEAVGACAPSGNCAAESLQTSGSFSYAQLKAQYQALGLDWFTATDHSYCINSDGEYAAIASEVAAITDGAFVARPDIELSSDEEGAQTGSDLAILLCFGTPHNHMGAHGLTSRLAGGGDGVLGFCSGLPTMSSSIAAVRAQGGFPIAHHPTASSFAWNSFAATTGIEAGGLHGVEIWNGAFVSGQGGDVGRWVDWLLGGRVLYAYSGSDTHDAAFAFGANHAVFQGEPFDAAGLQTVLEAGRLYVSNGPSLMVEVDLGGQTLFMGTRQAVPVQTLPDAALVRAHYDFGGDTGSVTVFAGRVGDAGESVLGQASGLTGSGFVEFPATVSGSARTWYRAYAQNASATETAYANPVFLDRVDALEADVASVSLSAGGSQALDVNAGLARGGDVYWIFGSATGTFPGTLLGTVLVPLNFDAYFVLTLKKPFLAPFNGFLGLLAADGTASASFGLPAGSDPDLAGITFFHAATTAAGFGAVEFATNAVSVTLVP